MNTKKFQNFRYDLKENIIYHDFKYAYKHLQHIAVYSYCSKLCKNESIIEYLKMWIEIPGQEWEFENKMMWIIFEKNPTLSEDLSFYVRKGVNLMGKEIMNFLQELDEKVYAPYFIKNLVFTNRGTINMKETVCEILEKENLSPESKFKLSCKFFLGNELITYYFKKIPRNIQMNYTVSKRKESNISPDIKFWIWHSKYLSNYLKDIDSSCKDDSDIQFDDLDVEELCSTFRDKNRMEIQYLWENFLAKESGTEKLLEKMLPVLLNDNLDLFIYFMLYLENNHGEFFNNFFKSEGLEILKKLYEEERWENIFIDVFGIIHLHLEEKNIKEIIYLLTHSTSYFEKKSLHYLQGISEVIAPSVKNYLTAKNGTFYYSIIKDLVQNEKILFITHIFKIIGRGNFHIFLNDEGIKCFEGLLKLQMFTYIDEVVKENFFSDDCLRLKIALEKLVLPICCNYIQYDDTKSIEIFLKWMYEDKNFKDKINVLLYQRQGDLILSFFRKDDICERDFDKIDNFLLWCLGSEYNVIEYKKKIVVTEEVSDDHHCVIIDFENIKDFVLLKKFNGLRFLFMWCLLNNDKIDRIKERLLYDCDLLNTLILKDDKVLLESFVSFCTNSPYEYLEFQRKILNDTELHVDLIKNGNFYTAFNLINWCGEYLDKEMNELKEKLFPLVLTYFVCDSTNYREFNDFMKWINVSWITFIKCHFTALGTNLLRVTENLFDFHIYFITKFNDYIISLFIAEERYDESLLLEE